MASGLKVVFVPRFLVRADAFDRPGRHAPFVFLLVDVAVAADLDFAPLRQEVDHGHAHAVQAAGGLVRALFELAAEFEHASSRLRAWKLAAHFLDS